MDDPSEKLNLTDYSVGARIVQVPTERHMIMYALSKSDMENLGTLNGATATAASLIALFLGLLGGAWWDIGLASEPIPEVARRTLYVLGGLLVLSIIGFVVVFCRRKSTMGRIRRETKIGGS